VSSGFARRWGTFVRERFPPLQNLPLVAAFFAANVAVGGRAAAEAPSVPRLVVAAALVLSFFVRLRIFDDVKDQATDVASNPGRPLARGLIAPREARAVAFALLALEGLMAATLGWSAIAAWLAAAAFSLLMFEEFFCGPWLRPKLELYAVTHTFVASLMAIMVFAAVSDAARRHGADLLFALASWAVFNVYEFSRKSFDVSEERPGVDTYSSRLGAWGAAALATSQAWLAVVLASAVAARPWSRAAFIALAAALTVPALTFALHRTPAKLLRGAAGLFILGFFTLAALSQLLWAPS
jgi:4-hydroxybenzoate polyprenyltransferase